LALCSLAWSTAAHAEGLSLDTELMQSAFSHRSVPGMDHPDIPMPGALRVGMLGQYMRDPVVFRTNVAGDVRSVVERRTDMQLGISYDIARRLSARLVLPAAYQQGGEMPELMSEGAGLRDLRVGGRVTIASSDLIAVGLRVDLHLPTGSDSAYMGEQEPRFDAGFLGRGSFGPVDLLLDGGFCGRKSVDAGYDLQVGSEAVANAALRVNTLGDRLAFGAAVLSRLGSQTVLDDSGTRAEALGLVQAWPVEQLQIDLGVGRGLTRGYGTSKGRALLSITWKAQLFDPPQDETLELEGMVLPEEIPQEAPTPLDLEPEDDDAWEEGELARVEAEAQQPVQITIRDDIQFQVGTAVILPESLPTLDAVAQLMASYWQIDHMLIEGHASEEGSYGNNFDLSIRRAQAIYRALVEAGVHPVRLSFRGFGEVDPVVVEEAQQARNRRVEFHTIRLLDPLEPPPRYTHSVRLPWSGEVVRIRQATERLVGQEMDFVTPVEPTEDHETKDLFRDFLRDEPIRDESGDDELEVDPEELDLPDDALELDDQEKRQ